MAMNAYSATYILATLVLAPLMSASQTQAGEVPRDRMLDPIVVGAGLQSGMTTRTVPEFYFRRGLLNSQGLGSKNHWKLEASQDHGKITGNIDVSLGLDDFKLFGQNAYYHFRTQNTGLATSVHWLGLMSSATNLPSGVMWIFDFGSVTDHRSKIHHDMTAFVGVRTQQRPTRFFSFDGSYMLSPEYGQQTAKEGGVPFRTEFSLETTLHLPAKIRLDARMIHERRHQKYYETETGPANYDHTQNLSIAAGVSRAF